MTTTTSLVIAAALQLLLSYLIARRVDKLEAKSKKSK